MRQLQVVKIGTDSVFHDGLVDYRVLSNLGYNLAKLTIEQNTDSVLVVSGAIRLGMRKNGLKEKPTNSVELQSCARDGQPALMETYEKGLFVGYKKYAAGNGTIARLLTPQYLVTYHNLEDLAEMRNIAANIRYDLSAMKLPLINYNDGVDPTEVKMDNDNLAARIAKALIADRLVIMTDVDGLFENFSDAGNRRLVKNVNEVNDYVRSLAEEKGDGTGKMGTKLDAADLLLKENIPTIIGNVNYGLIRLIEEEQIRTIFTK
ncbi:hypothetical protein HYV80_00455 [Candidatus Woesearchaeota archaeon]|nr:hypothetical protein [Candidatus Woesearchaeota archaeon]